METAAKNPSVPDQDSVAVGRVREALRGLRYGEVRIVVHDGSVVQVERTEKLRFVNSGDENVPLARSPANRASSAGASSPRATR